MDSVLNKRWIVEKMLNSSFCWIEVEDSGDIILDTPEVLEHIVALHNKHIDDIESLKAMRDKLCNSEDNV